MLEGQLSLTINPKQVELQLESAPNQQLNQFNIMDIVFKMISLILEI